MNKSQNEEIVAYKAEFRNSASKVLLSAVSMIDPTLGIASTIINEGLEFRARVEQNRINSLVKELNARVEELESKIVPLEYFDEDAFYDLSLKVYETAIRTSSKEKHMLISKIFINAIDESCKWEDDLYNLFLDTIKDFSKNHFLVLKFLIDNVNRDDIKSYEQLHQEFQKKLDNYEIDVYQFRHYCRAIDNKTLIRFSRDIYEVGSTGGALAIEGYNTLKKITLTSLGLQFKNLYT